MLSGFVRVLLVVFIETLECAVRQGVIFYLAFKLFPQSIIFGIDRYAVDLQFHVMLAKADNFSLKCRCKFLNLYTAFLQLRLKIKRWRESVINGIGHRVCPDLWAKWMIKRGAMDFGGDRKEFMKSLKAEMQRRIDLGVWSGSVDER